MKIAKQKNSESKNSTFCDIITPMRKNAKNIELLLPAGNLEKLKTAIYFGADAVYVGGKNFSLRAGAGNFTEEDLRQGTELVHSKGKKIYVTLNIYAHNRDIEAIKEELKLLEEIGVDAVLVSDMGILSLARKTVPNLAIHISTQANTTNYESVNMYKELGASRVVLARELSLSEIKEIHEKCDVELETFVHGAMCVGMSGRCLLSEYFTKRNANEGACSQPCRWEYKLQRTEKEEGIFIEEDDRGTYFFNSKDLRLIDYLKEMVDAGVYSFKVEGRMKSEFYVATVAIAYRKAIDDLLRDGKIERLNEYKRELETIAHRDYTTAYALGENQDTIYPKKGQIEESEIFIAKVLGEEKGMTLVEMRNRFVENDEISVLSPNEYCYSKTRVQEIWNTDGERVQDAKLVQAKYLLKIDIKLQEGDIIRRHRQPS